MNRVTNYRIFHSFQIIQTSRFEKLLTSYDDRAGLQFLGIRTADPCSCTSNTTKRQKTFHRSSNHPIKQKRPIEDPCRSLKIFIEAEIFQQPSVLFKSEM
jgi:hypothetical protein